MSVVTLYRVLPPAPVSSLDDVRAEVGIAFERARALGPDGTIAELDAAGLRGRGGGGFPTGRKWRTVRDARGSRRYVVVNGAEGEPGTFKDRSIVRRNPYQVVAGAAIAAFTIGANDIYIGVKAAFVSELDALEQATRALAEANFLDDLDVTIARGPDEYLFGEEKAMLEVIEGNDPLPRVLPPFQHGLFATAPQLGWTATEAEPGEAIGDRANPTLVNNVETLAHVTWILAHDAAAFREVGTEKSPGTMVFTVCGDVAAPGVFELPLGTPVRVLIDEHAAGTASGRPVKMVFSGVANAVLTGDTLDTGADFESLALAGAGLGSAGFIVYDDATCTLATRSSVLAFPFRRVVRAVSAVQAAVGRDHRRARTARTRWRRVATPAHPTRARDRGRRQPMLPRGRGAASGVERAACVPRGCRRAPGGPLRSRPRPGPAETRRLRRRHVPLRRETGAQAAGLDLYVMCTPRRPDQKGEARLP